MKDICKRLGIQPRLSTAYHPQTDGQTERINRDLQQYLRIFTSEKQNEWASWLPLAQFSYDAKKQLSTEKSLFEVTRSYQPKMGFEQRATKAPAADDKTDGRNFGTDKGEHRKGKDVYEASSKLK